MTSIIWGGCNETQIHPPCYRRPVRADAIEVSYDRKILASVSVARNLRTCGKAVIRVDESGVSVHYGGASYLRGVALPVWDPQPRWTFGLGAELHNLSDSAVEAKLADAGVRVDTWRLRSAYLYPAHVKPVRVSFNGQQFGGVSLPFDYYQPPVLSETSPSSGPMVGATAVLVRGEALRSFQPRLAHRLCRFTHSLGSANSSTTPCDAGPTSFKFGLVHCLSPASNATDAKLSLSLNGQQFHGEQEKAFIVDRGGSTRYRFELIPAVDSLIPRSGPLIGGTLITLHGSGFGIGNNYTCRYENGADPSDSIDTFNGALSPNGAIFLATYETGVSVLRCYSPAVLSARVVSVRISTNAQQYVSTNAKMTFAFYLPRILEAIEPSSGFLAGGGTNVTIHGAGLPEERALCKFGHHVVPATMTAPNAYCVAPKGAVAGASLECDSAEMQVHGCAQRQHGVVRLTHNPQEDPDTGRDQNQSGWAILKLALPDNTKPDLLHAFSLAFRLLVDSDGYGMSVSFGDLPDELLSREIPSHPSALPRVGEAGSGSGIRVLFVTGEAVQQQMSILVIVEGERLGSCALPTRPSTSTNGPWWNVFIEYRPVVLAPRHGLHVAFDGIDCLPPTPLPHWAPNEHWRFGIAARSRFDQTRYWVRELRLQLGSRVQSASVPLVVTGNLQQWSESARFVLPRRATRVPSGAADRAVGWWDGGHAFGSQLNGWASGRTRHLCRVASLSSETDFGDDTTADTPASAYIVPAVFSTFDGTLHCELPPVAKLPAVLASLAGASAPLAIRMSSNGQQFSRDVHFFNYFMEHAHVAHQLVPVSGPTRGGALIHMRMIDFNLSSAEAIRVDGRAACLFNGTRAVASVAADGTALHCVTPPMQDVGDSELSVSLNGQQVLPSKPRPFNKSIAYGASAPTLFNVYSMPTLEQLQPLTGSHLRGFSISVHLFPPVSLAAASGVICSFGGDATLGVLLPPVTPLHETAAGVVYAPRMLTPIARLTTVPHILDGHTGYDGNSLQDRFLQNGLAPGLVDFIQYDGDPIDAEGEEMQRGPRSKYSVSGTRYAFDNYLGHYRGTGIDVEKGRVEFFGSATVLEWHFEGRSTCVGYGPPEDFCNSSQLVCAGPNGEEYGNYDQQAKAAVRAITTAGGVHPRCPIFHQFDHGAKAWLHGSASDWLHSTAVDRGDVATSTPLGNSVALARVRCQQTCLASQLHGARLLGRSRHLAIVARLQLRQQGDLRCTCDRVQRVARRRRQTSPGTTASNACRPPHVQRIHERFRSPAAASFGGGRGWSTVCHGQRTRRRCRRDSQRIAHAEASRRVQHHRRWPRERRRGTCCVIRRWPA